MPSTCFSGKALPGASESSRADGRPSAGTRLGSRKAEAMDDLVLRARQFLTQRLTIPGFREPRLQGEAPTGGPLAGGHPRYRAAGRETLAELRAFLAGSAVVALGGRPVAPGLRPGEGRWVLAVAPGAGPTWVIDTASFDLGLVRAELSVRPVVAHDAAPVLGTLARWGVWP